jgi:O-antigen ligase
MPLKLRPSSTSASTASSANDPFTQRFLLATFAFLAAATPLCLFLGVRGFAPVVGLAGAVCLAFARPSRSDWPGIALLLLLVVWATIGLAWTPAPNLHGLGSLKTFFRSTLFHLALQLLLCTALVTGLARLAPENAERALTWLAFALLAGMALLTEEGLSHAAVYQAMMAAVHQHTRPDLAIRALAQGGFATAVLVWPLGMLLRRQGRTPLALMLAVFVPLTLILMRGFAPSAALAVSLPVYVLVRRFGRPAILAVMGFTAAYMLLTPLFMLAIDHFGVYAQMKPHLPPSWAERLRIWSFVADQFVQHPLRGAGLDASRTFPGIVPLHPHNGPLQLWYELGALGALLGTGFWVWLWLRIAARAEGDRLFAAVASATAAVYIVISAVGFGLWQEWWLCVGALAMSVCVVFAKTLDTARPGPSETS